ncbi:diguanylate cyclase [Salinisphaera sp.]|uniref:sensor domain-containing diguanylate cyclase n=1 Tax=Salinisphaera sp. TaxID=1914330 RepID=UPI0025D33D26|nr:diguanylate cyclase [Salinisphaera sp.]
MKPSDEAATGTHTFPYDGEALQTVLAHTFALMPEAVLLADTDRRIIMVNDAAVALFRYAREELLGRTTQMLYAHRADFQETGRTRYNRRAAHHTQTYLMRYRRKDGSEFDGETIGGPILGAEGDGPMFLGIIRDQSARVANEHALHGLHAITSDQSLSFADRRHAILELGCEHFGMPIGMVSHIEDQAYQVVDIVDGVSDIKPGQVFPVSETYCCHTIVAEGPFAVDRTGEGELCEHPCYQRFALESYIGAPLTLDGQIVGTLNFSSTEPTGEFTTYDLDLIGMFAQWLDHEIARERDLLALRGAQDELARLALTDELTGIYNRRAIGARMQEELNRAQRYAQPVSVALVDFDRFKQLNDQHGHIAGDRALQLFAELATKQLRNLDSVGRWGGEEFVLLLPNTDANAAMTTAQRLLETIRGAGCTVDGTAVPLTVSAGLATTQGDESIETLIDRADQALYEAKANGRDQAIAGSALSGPSRSI